MTKKLDARPLEIIVFTVKKNSLTRGQPTMRMDRKAQRVGPTVLMSPTR